MEYIIRSDYDCIVKNQFDEKFLDKNSELVFDKPEMLLIYPTNAKNLLPFVLDLSSETSDKFSAFIYESSRFYYLMNKSKIENCYIENFKYNGENYSIKLSQEKVVFISQRSEKSVYLEDVFEDYSYQILNKLLLLHLIGKTETLFCYNLENGKIKQIKGDKIEQIENQILLSKDVDNLLHQKIFETYIIKDNEIKQTAKSIKNEEYNGFYDESLIGYVFLESVKSEDYEFAKNLLSDELKNQISTNHLRDYFGKFDKFIHLKNQDFAIFNNTSTFIYSFKIFDKKITEISNF